MISGGLAAKSKTIFYPASFICLYLVKLLRFINRDSWLDGRRLRHDDGLDAVARCTEAGQPFFLISAATGVGLRDLVAAIAARLDATGWLRAAS